MAKRKMFKQGVASLAVIIPSTISESLDINKSDVMDIKQVGNKVVITKVKKED